MAFHHLSVLRNETVRALVGDVTGVYVDCTLGGGGHSFALAELLAPEATIIGLDQDGDAVAAASERMKMCLAGLFPCGVTSVTWEKPWMSWE